MANAYFTSNHVFEQGVLQALGACKVFTVSMKQWVVICCIVCVHPVSSSSARPELFMDSKESLDHPLSLFSFVALSIFYATSSHASSGLGLPSDRCLLAAQTPMWFCSYWRHAHYKTWAKRLWKKMNNTKKVLSVHMNTFLGCVQMCK